MTNEELAVRIQQGETELIPTLWEQVERFIRGKARHRVQTLGGFGGVEVDDLCQSGFFALMDAVKAFDPQTGYRFITYLNFPLKNAFADAAGYHTERKRMDPLHRYIDINTRRGEDGEGESLGDMIADPAAQEAFLAVEDGQLQDVLNNALERLPEAQKQAVIARYCLGRDLSRKELEAERAAIQALRRPRIRKELKVFC